MRKRQFHAAIVIGAALALASCSSTKAPATENTTDTAKKAVEPPPAPVPAKNAFWEMYRPAREWATDLLPLTLASDSIPGYKNDGGKAAVWIAVFVSPSRMRARTYTYAIVDHLPDVHKGVTSSPEAEWSGAIPTSKPFQTVEFQIDSDAAFAAAHEKGMSFLEKHADLPVSMYLASMNRFASPVWFVMWGTKKLGYAEYVDATTGQIMK